MILVLGKNDSSPAKFFGCGESGGLVSGESEGVAIEHVGGHVLVGDTKRIQRKFGGEKIRRDCRSEERALRAGVVSVPMFFPQTSGMVLCRHAFPVQLGPASACRRGWEWIRSLNEIDKMIPVPQNSFFVVIWAAWFLGKVRV